MAITEMDISGDDGYDDYNDDDDGYMMVTMVMVMMMIVVMMMMVVMMPKKQADTRSSIRHTRKRPVQCYLQRKEQHLDKDGKWVL